MSAANRKPTNFRNWQPPQNDVRSFDALVKSARTSGNINLANRNLEEIPDSVCNILDEKYIGQDEKWQVMVHVQFAVPSLVSTHNARCRWECVPLKSLNLNGNHIRGVPSSIKLLVELTSLDLSHNALVDLPPELFEVICDTAINLKHISHAYSQNRCLLSKSLTFPTTNSKHCPTILVVILYNLCLPILAALFFLVYFASTTAFRRLLTDSIFFGGWNRRRSSFG